ncbi:MAG: very short patch repair endonuclease, partial [Parvularculaceae bacterium]|nr:very short patch repair endonuclease [Parvularculaceae bacterium]
MRAVKGTDTGPERALRKSLFKLGFRYRLNAKGLPGKPDLVFPKYRAIVFVHGCFWHGHD